MADMPKFEVPEQVRDMAEKSVEQARKAFEGFVGATQEAVAKVEDQAKSSQETGKSMGQEALSFAETQITRAFDLADSLVRAKDPQELIALQSAFVQEQMKIVGDQTKAMGEKVMAATQEAAKNVSK